MLRYVTLLQQPALHQSPFLCDPATSIADFRYTMRSQMITTILCAQLALLAVLTSGSFLHPAYAAEIRVLHRDVAQGGPSEVDASTLTSYFEDENLQQALYALSEGDGEPAISAIPQFLHDHPTHPYAGQARFALGYAFYVEEQWDAAYRTLTESVEALPLMRNYANFWASEAAENTGRYNDALRLAETIPAESRFGPRADFLEARVLVALNRLDEGIRAMEQFIEQHPDAWYREKVDIALGQALERAERFPEAARVYARAKTVYPDSSIEAEAEAGLERVLPRLSSELRREFRETGIDDVLARAEALYEKHRSERVIELLNRYSGQSAEGTEERCEIEYMIGKSYSKLRQHGNSIPHYESVRDHCSGEMKVKGLYNLGKAYWNADRDMEAIAAYRALVEEFPTHSYADDSVLYIARIHRSRDESAGYREALNEQIRRFPDGDMLKDAVWLLVVEDYQAGRFAEVVRFVDSLGVATGEDDLYSRGRLAYFRARSLEVLSRGTEARVVYRQLIETQPLGYYALLSFQRLQRMDPEYSALLEESMVSSESESETLELELVAVPDALASSPGFSRGRVFIRLGLMSLAEDEFDDLREQTGSRVDVDRALATLLQRAGAYHLGYRGPAQRVAHTTSYPDRATVEDWLLAYPRPFDAMVQQNAAERGLDPWLVYAIMREESRFQPDVESWANARGLMQLMIGTARDMANQLDMQRVEPRDLFDPATNIALGTRFLQYLAERFSSHPFLMAAGYNAGGGSVSGWLEKFEGMEADLWVEEIPFKQTRHYVKRVCRTWWVYHWLYDTDRVVDINYSLAP